MNSTANILIVDDDRLNLKIVAWALSHAGFAITTATDGEAAMACLNTEPFDVVVSDVQMPRMDGIELLQNIRALFPWLPVILMTGAVHDEVRQAALTWGAVALLEKPVSYVDLILTIQAEMELPRELTPADCELFPSSGPAQNLNLNVRN